MMHTVTTYLPFTKATFKSEYFAYKSRFFLWAVANAVSFLAQLFLWKAIYASADTEILNGYSFAEMVLYLGVSKIVECMSFASVEGNVSKGIRDGRIANSLIKPISYRVELLFRSFGQILGSVCLFLPLYLCIFVIFICKNHVEVNVRLSGLVIGCCYLVLAFMLNYYISLIFSCVIFKTVKSSGIYQLKKTLLSFLSGSLFPIAFYPKFLQRTMQYLPFTYLRYYPNIVLQGKMTGADSIQLLGIGVLWLVVLAFLSTKLWDRMLKNIMVFGG